MLQQRLVVVLLLLMALVGTANGARSRQRKGAQAKHKTGGSSSSKKKTRPPSYSFVLQSVDEKWLCFGGDRPRRCGLDTLWYQSQTREGLGANLHQRSAADALSPLSASGGQLGDSCLIRESCNLDEDASKNLAVGSCSQSCSALQWAIEHDTVTGSAVITFNGTQLCAMFNATANRFQLGGCLDSKYAMFVQYSTFSHT